MKTAKIFQPGMILQRDKPVPIWGNAKPGEVVSVTIQGQTAECVAGEDGKWLAVLAPLHSSEHESLDISGEFDHISLDNVAVGEVWLAGGQSNMEFHMRYEKHLTSVKPECSNSRIRFYDVPEVAFDGQDECFDYSRMGLWRSAAPEDIEYFSAVGYYFERALEADLNVPVGIVGCNWGGTVSAAWMNPATVRKCGLAWMEEYEAFAARTQWEEYWQAQRSNPLNGRGNPFADPFGELVMPRTPTAEELNAFFASMQASGAFPDLNELSFLPHNIPGALYSHMLSEAAPFAIRGFLWYQGESDDEMHHADLYASMLKGLISDWRELWEDETLPFLIVQLPGYERWMQNTCDRFDLIRDAQEEASRTVPFVWLCSISDAGEQFDIHPKNKQPVGERLALLARGHVYGEKVLCDAPVAKGAKRNGNTITIVFDHAEGGLVLKGKQIAALSVSADGKALSCQTNISGDSIILQVPGEVPGTVRIDFAKDKFYLVNLYNQSGIPAIPFSMSVHTESEV